jgi:hypothetical protein
MKQVLVIGQDGSIGGLVHEGKGIDLLTFGKAQIKRATIIEWSELLQGWYIEWYKSSWFDPVWRKSLVSGLTDETVLEILKKAKEMPSGSFTDGSIDDPVLVFPTYKDAVAVEVAVIQSRQKVGLACA